MRIYKVFCYFTGEFIDVFAPNSVIAKNILKEMTGLELSQFADIGEDQIIIAT